ncbi:hypothetical protein QYF61_018602 [Mycteria americana]|uniref:Uncharacterized protein n=1 Tax=Mycteria americana TaxID=33587 RepID=A0AAN7RZJ5_MYCAM|nr:hypothetical protein QYF61_018602 [Mycteria americana]
MTDTPDESPEGPGEAGEMRETNLMKDNPIHQYMLGADKLEDNSAEKDLGILLDNKLTIISNQRSIFPVRKACKIWNCSAWRREGSVGAGRGGRMSSMCKYLMGGNDEEGAKLFSVVAIDRTRSNRNKLKHVKFQLNTRKQFLSVRVDKHWNRLPREGGCLAAPAHSQSPRPPGTGEVNPVPTLQSWAQTLIPTPPALDMKESQGSIILYTLAPLVMYSPELSSNPGVAEVQGRGMDAPTDSQSLLELLLLCGGLTLPGHQVPTKLLYHSRSSAGQGEKN